MILDQGALEAVEHFKSELLKRPEPDVFAGVDWASPEVMSAGAQFIRAKMSEQSILRKILAPQTAKPSTVLMSKDMYKDIIAWG